MTETRRRQPPIAGVLKDLVEKNQLKSDILLVLLENEKEKRKLLNERKEEIDQFTQELLTRTIDQVDDKFTKLNEDFVRIKNDMDKTVEEKLPSKYYHLKSFEVLEKLDDLDRCDTYLSLRNIIERSSNEMEKCFTSGVADDRAIISAYNQLLSVQNLRVMQTECNHLKNYYLSTCTYWEEKLDEKYTKIFENFLATYGWPTKIGSSSSIIEKPEKFHKSIKTIVKLSYAKEIYKCVRDRPSEINDFTMPNVPIMLMVKPLKKRFHFHFYGSKITGDSSKPEWYFSQVKNWIRELIPFIREHIEPITMSDIKSSSIVEFIRELSEILKIKIESQIKHNNDENQIVDDVIFAKILEESIIYENEIGRFLIEELGQNQLYVSPFVSSIFSDQFILQRWINLEKKAYLEKLDEMFSSDSAWNRPIIPGPAEIVDLFIALLRFVINRFSHLQKPEDRTHFVYLLIEIIDDFRIRCLQTWKSRSSIGEMGHDEILVDYIIADTLEYLQKTIESWEDLPFFASLLIHLEKVKENGIQNQNLEKLKIQRADDEENIKLNEGKNINPFENIHLMPLKSFKMTSKLIAGLILSNDSNSENSSKRFWFDPVEGVFTNVLKFYSCLSEDILSNWSIEMARKLKPKVIENYSRKKWQVFPDDGFEEGGSTISEELLSPLQILQSVCKAVQSGMDQKLREKWLKKLAVQIDEMFLESVIIPNKFSPGAIRQIEYDISTGLFSIFSEYNIESALFMGGLTCTLNIWRMSQGDALLLHETLSDSKNSFQLKEETLCEIGLVLKPKLVQCILTTRNDIRL